MREEPSGHRCHLNQQDGACRMGGTGELRRTGPSGIVREKDLMKLQGDGVEEPLGGPI